MIIQCDFDGTIIENNLSVLIREYFAPEAWRAIETDYLEGRITVEESNRRQFTAHSIKIGNKNEKGMKK